MRKAFDVADYIISSIPVDNLKLQKLLYYSQAVHMVLKDSFETPLFSDSIEAWQYGPVVPAVYRKYRKNGFDEIRPDRKKNSLSPEEMRTVDIVLGYYGNMSGVQLIGKTHSESPWKDVYVPRQRHILISNKSIYDYFKDVLEFDEAER